MRPVFLLDAAAPSEVAGPVALSALARAVLPADLAARAAGEARVKATTRIALRPEGPYAPIADALSSSVRLRELFVEGLDPPCVRTYRRVRFTLALALVPLLLLAELDRELWVVGARGAGVRALVDLLLAAFAAAGFLARAPSYPVTTAIVLLSTAARYAMLVAKPCGDAAPIFWVSGAVSFAGAIAFLFVAPSPARVVRESLARVGVSQEDVRAVRQRARPSAAYVGSALGAAVLLPAVLWLSRWASVPMLAQTAIFAVYAALVPAAIEHWFEPRARDVRRGSRAVALAVGVGFSLTVAATDASRHALDTAAYAEKCADPAAYESSATKRLIDAQTREVVHSGPDEGGRWAILFLNVLVVPLVEERVYRGLLQRVLVARLGGARGIAGAAVVFGLAHLGVYRVAIYQTTVLGAAFGVAYAGGGLGAAAVVHALWNLRSAL